MSSTVEYVLVKKISYHNPYYVSHVFEFFKIDEKTQSAITDNSGIKPGEEILFKQVSFKKQSASDCFDLMKDGLVHIASVIGDELKRIKLHSKSLLDLVKSE